MQRRWFGQGRPDLRGERSPAAAPAVRVEILAYAPTRFFHCAPCEVVWDQVGLGGRWHADQRTTALPLELQAEYAAIVAWAQDALARHGDRLRLNVVDAASVEGVFKALRRGVRRFPAFIFDGRERVLGFDRARLDAALEARLGPVQRPPAGKEVPAAPGG